MNKKLSVISLSVLIFISLTVMGFAGNKGDQIRHTMVDGYHLTYKLIDMREKMKEMGHDHSGQKMATHHLMLFIKSSDSKPVKDARVGYLVTNKSGTKEKAMAMMMGDGYGSDVTLDKPGEYSIKVKAVTSGNKIIDEFVYTLKK